MDQPPLAAGGGASGRHYRCQGLVFTNESFSGYLVKKSSPFVMPNKSQPKSETPASSTGWVKLTSLPGQKVDNAKYGFNYWRIENGVVWHQRWCLKKADPASFEVREDYSQIYIGRDINHVFYAKTLVSEIDRDTFRAVENGYWIDRHHAYCEHETSITPLKGNDASHFKYIGGPYARDSVFAYYGGRVLKTCTAPLKLQLLAGADSWYAGDQTRIWFDGSELVGVDFESWEHIDRGFSKDKKAVYFGSKRLPGVKPESWERLEGTYSRDRASVYYMWFKIKGADPKSWKLLPHRYSKDASAVYHGFRAIPGADPLTFKVTSEGSAKDRNGSYDNGVLQKA